MKTNKPEVAMTLLGGEPLIRLSDYERLQADHERLQSELDMWKAMIDAMAEHEVAAYQLIGIPASVGISEPIEGFAKRPQDIMPAVRDMALRIEALQAECEKLRKDAERYQQVKHLLLRPTTACGQTHHELDLWSDHADFDQAIDAAMKGDKP